MHVAYGEKADSYENLGIRMLRVAKNSVEGLWNCVASARSGGEKRQAMERKTSESEVKMGVNDRKEGERRRKKQ